VHGPPFCGHCQNDWLAGGLALATPELSLSSKMAPSIEIMAQRQRHPIYGAETGNIRLDMEAIQKQLGIPYSQHPSMHDHLSFVQAKYVVEPDRDYTVEASVARQSV